jgi:hypothetical protein
MESLLSTSSVIVFPVSVFTKICILPSPECGWWSGGGSGVRQRRGLHGLYIGGASEGKWSWRSRYETLGALDGQARMVGVGAKWALGRVFSGN